MEIKKNKESMKVSKKIKDFIKQMQINRIKLDLKQLTQVEAMELIVNYFKRNNDLYLQMIREEENVRRVD